MNIKIVTLCSLLLAMSAFAMDKKSDGVTEKHEEYKKFLQALFIESQATPAPVSEKPTMVSCEDAATLQERYAKINNQKKKTRDAKYRN